jgi:hypothetical protein
MATSSRIYKPTDWQLWMFLGEPGIFRLDFSLLNGSDVLGDFDEEGKMTLVDVPFSSISIIDGSPTNQGTFAELTPSSAVFTFQTENFQKTDFVEYYSGKQIALTLKNQITNPTFSNTMFGYNTPYFVGKINDVLISVDPLSKFTTVTITAAENLAGIFNQPLTINKNTTAFARDQIGTAIQAILTPVQNWAEMNFFFGWLESHFGTTGSETKSSGDWLSDLAIADVGFYASQWIGNGTFFKKNINFQQFPYKTAPAGLGKTRTIELENVSSIEFGIDGYQNPTSYIIKTAAGSVFNFPASQYSTLSELIVKELNIDIKDFTEANANNYARSLFATEFTAIKISVLNAYEDQQIVFDNLDWSSSSASLLRPITNADVGWQIILDLSEYGYSSAEKFNVTSKEDEITKEYWITHYYLTKGRAYF